MRLIELYKHVHALLDEQNELRRPPYSLMANPGPQKLLDKRSLNQLVTLSQNVDRVWAEKQEHLGEGLSEPDRKVSHGTMVETGLG